MRQKKYVRKVLEPLVAESSSFAEVMRRLGLRPTGGNHRVITARIRECGLDTSHFGAGHKARIAAISEDELRVAVANAPSFARVAASYGIPTNGRALVELTARIRALGLDTSHMRGPAWSRGETADTHPTLKRICQERRFSDEQVFCENSSALNGPRIVKRLIERGWVYECKQCGIAEWHGKPLVLHLDHINGIHNDNRVENLRLLCPNCHSQTATYSNKPRMKASEPRAHYSCYMNATPRACWNR
jgi:Zn finger protein HypA/HybF involved in hydrogenase expression